MTGTPTVYITYFIRQQAKTQPNRSAGPQLSASTLEEFIQQQQAQVDAFLMLEPHREVSQNFIEAVEYRKNQKWPQLQLALAACQQQGASLLIPELGVLTNNDTFTQYLLKAKVNFHCIDQPFVNATILEALYKHAQIQKKMHGRLIKEGLKMTTAKSGNPNAAEVISKVNKPKIDTAIVFAFLLQPIIQNYKRKGFSQRHMVKSLNEEGFTAPEGGRWVLSQLQKVLDRVRLNELALEFKPILADFESRGLTVQQMTEELNTRQVPSPKRTPWDERHLKKITERVQQIQDILFINQFVLNLLPIIHLLEAESLSSEQMLDRFLQAGFSLNAEPTNAGNSASGHLTDLFTSLRHDARQAPADHRDLAAQLESAAKHVPAYVKIVKSHIDQLAAVLASDNHNRRTLESVNLAEPVTQLIEIFATLAQDDVMILEDLAMIARQQSSQKQDHAELQQRSVNHDIREYT